MTELISVLMSVYGESVPHLKLAVDSIRKQTYKNIELLIISDNPVNNDANKYLRSLPLVDSRIKIFFNKQNLRLPKSHNKILEFASGNYLAHMDADDIAKRDRLEKELRLLKNNDLDFVSSNVLDIDLDGNALGTGTNYPVNDKQIKRFLKYGDCLPSSSWLCKKSIFKMLGGYRDIVVCEDYDVLLRGALAGVKFGLIKEPLVYYRYNPKGVSKQKEILLDVISIYMQRKYIHHEKFSLKQLNTFIHSNEASTMNRDLRKFNLLINSHPRFCILKLLQLMIISKTIRYQMKKKILRKLIRKD